MHVYDTTDHDGSQQEPIFKKSESIEATNSSDVAALTAVKMALKFKQMNNSIKALKLFNHALILSPKNDFVLLHYGEYLESNNNIIEADFYYLKALKINPKNSRALTNHRRTLPLVKELDLKELKRIDKTKDIVVNFNKNNCHLKELEKEISLHHIFNSVAIEGNTMSFDETRTVLETRNKIPRKSSLEYNEIIGLDTALQYVTQILASQTSNITISDILEIHQKVMKQVNPTIAGIFRKSQVFVNGYVPPAASDVGGLMETFVQKLNSPPVINFHPIHIAAFAHHELASIHPFTDGNGRTSRLLMNLVFLKYGYPPIIVRREDKSEYFECLDIAHKWDIRPFYRFIAHATERSFDAYLLAHDSKQSKLKAFESENCIRNCIILE